MRLLNDLREPEGDAIVAGGHSKVGQAEQPYGHAAKCIHQTMPGLTRFLFQLFFLFQTQEDQLLFIFSQPSRLGGPVGEEIESDQARDNRRDALDKKQPLPGRKVSHAAHPGPKSSRI